VRGSRVCDARLTVAVVAAVLGLRLLFVDVGEPRAGRFALARSNLKEDLLDARGDFAATPRADRDPINGTNGRDFGGRARKEKLVRDIERGALNTSLFDRNAEPATNLYDAVARNARQDRGRKRRCHDLA